MATQPRTTSNTAHLPQPKPGVQFTATRDEITIIAKIAQRAVRMAMRLSPGFDYSQQDAMMDIEACHSNGCPLKLAELLATDDGNFGHDVFGIRRFIDRETGVLGGSFLPRFAKPVWAATCPDCGAPTTETGACSVPCGR